VTTMSTQRLSDSDADLTRAAGLLLAGEIVAIPTETVYGLAVRADDPAAIARVYAAKGRPSDNPLIVHVASVDALEGIAQNITPLAALLLDRFSPGPLTLVLDAHPDLPRAVTAGLDTVAVRIPGHPIALEVLRRCGVALAAPSANRSGRPSPTAAIHVLTDLDGSIAAVVEGGRSRVGLESTIIDARGSRPIVLREGAVTQEDLLIACGAPAATDGLDHAMNDPASLAHVPGTRHQHYAPNIPVHVARVGEAGPAAIVVLDDLRSHAVESPGSNIGVGLITVGASTPVPEIAGIDAIVHLANPGDASELAAGLFQYLRSAEERGLSALVIEQVREEGIGRAVMDRLRRASEGSGGTLPPVRSAHDR